MEKSEMENRIRALIKQYAPSGTAFRWDRAVRRFGSCRYSRNRRTGEIFDIVISISYPLASRNSWEDVKYTVLHEIAHARAPFHGHDSVWRRECIAIGGKGDRCYADTNHGGTIIPVPQKFVGTCIACGAKFYRTRKIDPTLRYYHCRKDMPISWEYNREYKLKEVG